MFTWLIEHLLSALPAWLWMFVAAGSIAVYFLAGIIGKFPQVKPYALFIKPVALIVTGISIFFWGGSGVADMYNKRVDELNTELATAKSASKGANVEIKTVYVDRVKVVKDTQVKVVHDIQRDAAQMDATCKVDPSAIKDLNEAAK